MAKWKGVDPGEWARQTKERLLAVAQGSVQELSQEMTKTLPNGGNVPVKTGNLARSLLAQNGSMPNTGTGPFAGQDIGPVLLNMNLGDKIYLGFQANYARRQNYGFVGEDSLGRNYNQSGFGFVEKAADKWPQIVTKVVAEVRGRSGG